jgi:DNA-directed RNA polymerase specialized sigma24 family protein
MATPQPTGRAARRAGGDVCVITDIRNNAPGWKRSTVTALLLAAGNHVAYNREGDRRRRHLLADYQRHVDCVHASLDVVLLRLDVRLALAALTPHERAVCEGLGLGQSWRHVAALLGCSDRKVRRTVEPLRRRFHVMGLHGWLEDSGT